MSNTKTNLSDEEILSLAKKKTDFALKLVFDTVLGETDRHHFYDSLNQPVKGEVIL